MEPAPAIDCPHCNAIEAMTESEIDEPLRQIIDYTQGNIDTLPNDLLDPNPNCPECQRMANIMGKELDAGLAGLSRL